MKGFILFTILLGILALAIGCKTVSKVDLPDSAAMQMERPVWQNGGESSI